LPIVAVAEATLIDDVGPQPSQPPFRDKPPIAKFAIDPPPIPQLPVALPPVETLPPAPQIPANGQPFQIHYHIYNAPPATPPLANPPPAPNINVNVSPVISVGARSDSYSDSYANADADNYIDDDVVVVSENKTQAKFDIAPPAKETSLADFIIGILAFLLICFGVVVCAGIISGR